MAYFSPNQTFLDSHNNLLLVLIDEEIRKLNFPKEKVALRPELSYDQLKDAQDGFLEDFPEYLKKLEAEVMTLADPNWNYRLPEKVLRKYLGALDLITEFRLIPEEKDLRGRFEDLILKYGVHSHLDRFKVKLDLKAVKVAQHYCQFIGRNFEEEIKGHFKGGRNDIISFLINSSKQ